MSAIGLAELADRTRMEPNGWSVLVVEESQIGATCEELRGELAFLLEDEGVGGVRVFAEREYDAALAEELARLAPEDVALLPVSSDRIGAVSHTLDYGRERLGWSLRRR